MTECTIVKSCINLAVVNLRLTWYSGVTTKEAVCGRHLVQYVSGYERNLQGIMPEKMEITKCQ